MRLSTALEPLRGNAFRCQFGAYTISMVGTMLSPVALTLGLLEVTGSGATIGLALGAGTVPLAIFLLIGGVWADRLPRHLIMMGSDLVRAAVQLIVGAMLLSGQVPLIPLLLLEAVYGTAQAFYLPASVGLTALTTPAAQLQRANALLSGVRSLSGIVGAVLAGVLVTTVGAGWALVIDGVSYVVSALLVTRLRLPRSARPARATVRQDLSAGFRTVSRTPWIWSSIVAFMSTHIAVAVLMVVGPVLVLAAGDGALGWSAIIAALGVGSLLGDGLALVTRPLRPLRSARIAELLLVPALIAVAVDAPILLQAVAVAAAGAGLTFADALWLTALQSRLPEESLSKVSAYDWMGSVVLRPLGYTVGGIFAGTAGAAGVLVAAAGLVVITRVVSLSFAEVRDLRAPELVEASR